MHDCPKKLSLILNKVNEIVKQKQLKTNPKIIVVTKKFSIDKILPLIEAGHMDYGENKVQEAEDKWISVKKNYINLKLHFVGNLQSNKAKKAIKLFDYIHSLDNAKLASKIFQYQKELNKEVKLFISVNLGDEEQKSGVSLNKLNNFYDYCTKELSLNIIGLMCLPPIGENAQEYFKQLKNAADKLNLNNLSMGMSSDFENALICGSTHLRLGTIIMGERVSVN
jgi:pyridoxal phosphate enzyme (YggS family)